MTYFSSALMAVRAVEQCSSKNAPDLKVGTQHSILMQGLQFLLALNSKLVQEDVSLGRSVKSEFKSSCG